MSTTNKNTGQDDFGMLPASRACQMFPILPHSSNLLFIKLAFAGAAACLPGKECCHNPYVESSVVLSLISLSQGEDCAAVGRGMREERELSGCLITIPIIGKGRRHICECTVQVRFWRCWVERESFSTLAFHLL